MPSALAFRKADLVYVTYFIAHIFVIICLDSYILWPKAYVPGFMTTLRQYYMATYKDQFFTKPPAWYIYYVVQEVIYQLPTCISSIQGLYTGKQITPLYVLCYSLQAINLRGMYVVEIMRWSHVTTAERNALLWLHGPSVLFLAFLGSDMFSRVKKSMEKQQTVQKLEHSSKT